MKTSALLLTGLIVATTQAAAQTAGQNATPSSTQSRQHSRLSDGADCDYNTCALRMKFSRGDWLIIRGAQEKRVEKLGMFRSAKLHTLVAGSPEAVAEARVFERNYVPGEVWQTVGALIAGVSLVAANRDESAVLPVAGTLAGSGILFYGLIRSVRAMNALHKTIWIYNGSLKR